MQSIDVFGHARTTDVLELVAAIGTITSARFLVTTRMPRKGFVIARLAVGFAYGHMAATGEARPERAALAETAELVVAVEAFGLLSDTAT